MYVPILLRVRDIVDFISDRNVFMRSFNQLNPEVSVGNAGKIRTYLLCTPNALHALCLLACEGDHSTYPSV